MPSRLQTQVILSSKEDKQKVQIPSGVIHQVWDDQSPITLQGYLPVFSEYLLSGELFSGWCNESPLEYKSNNAPEVPDVLGTAVLSVLSGHHRYSHAASLYGDEVAPELLGIGKVVSHDSLSRGLGKMEEPLARSWMQKHLLKTVEPLLQAPYVLDIDPTVKPLYGHQEGAAKGYNPKKPGRPSLCYHTYFVANLRLLLSVDVRAGNETAGCYSHPVLWSLLDRLPTELHPSFVRGDIGFGNEGTMHGCEERRVNYLFKLKQTKKVKDLIETLHIPEQQWDDGGDGWQCVDTSLRLCGWSRARRVIVFRRQRRDGKSQGRPALPQLQAAEEDLLFPVSLLPDDEDICEYEYSVLVTDLEDPPVTIAQLYRDRADCENALDELKNQWGWGGFTSQELKRTQIMAMIVALVYNWWNIFCRLANPDKHMEATTSRPVFQQIVGRLVKTGGQRIIRLCATGAKAEWAQEALAQIGRFLGGLLTATQLTPEQRWSRILSHAFRKFLKGLLVNPVADGDQMLLLI